MKVFSYNLNGLGNNFLGLKRNLFPVVMFEKTSKNRNLRLFDKDVIIKKIICHFFKFSASLINFIEREFKVKIKLNNTIKQKKRSQRCFRNILWMKVGVLDETCTESNLPQKVIKVLSLNCFDLYKNYFLNSNYFQEITQNFKTRHGELYFQYFIYICDEFPKSIYNNIKCNIKQ